MNVLVLPELEKKETKVKRRFLPAEKCFLGPDKAGFHRIAPRDSNPGQEFMLSVGTYEISFAVGSHCAAPSCWLDDYPSDDSRAPGKLTPALKVDRAGIFMKLCGSYLI